MASPEELFRSLIGRPPTDQERIQIMTLRTQTGAPDDDAMWIVMIGTGYAATLFETLPDKVAATADEVLKGVKQTAQTEIAAAVQQGQAALVQISTDTIRQVARDTTRKEKVKWVAGCTVVVALVLALGFGYVQHTAYAAGSRHGERVGYDKAKDEQAAAAWANTPEGKAARRLAQANSSRFMSEMEACTWGPGWHRKKSKHDRKKWVCFPQPKDGNVRGWRVP